MRLGNRDISTGDLLPADRFPVSLNVFKTLVWLWVFSAVVAMKPSAAEGSPQKTVRKETPKSKPTPKTDSTRKISNSPAHNALFRQEAASVDPLEKREHVVQQTKLGDTLPELLRRFRVPQTEKQRWTRYVRQSFGAQALPPGKEIHFYFSKPALRGRSQRAPGQLKALEVDYNDVSTLTWEKGIKGILFKKREQHSDVELNNVSASEEKSYLDVVKIVGVNLQYSFIHLDIIYMID